MGRSTRTLVAQYTQILGDTEVVHALAVDQARQNRLHEGKNPISREYDLARQNLRSDATVALALGTILEVIKQREIQQIPDLQRIAHPTEPSYTFATFSSGGCCDTIASLMTGLTPLWGTEICERKRNA